MTQPHDAEDVARSKAHEANLEKLKTPEVQEKYRGQWVAIEDGEIIASGTSTEVRAYAYANAKDVSHTLVSIVHSDPVIP